MRNCYFVIFNGRDWEKRRGGRRVRDYIFRRDSTDVHWHILRSQLPRQGARFALDSSISLNDGVEMSRSPQPATRSYPLPLSFLGSTSASTCVGHICHRN